MTKKEKVELKKEAKKMFYDFMDKRDKVYKLLDEFKTEHGFIPEQYKGDIMLMNALAEYKRLGGWRRTPGTKLIINKAIQKYCKNKVKNPQPEKPMTEKERELYLKEKTDEIYASVNKAKKELDRIHNKVDIDKSIKT